MMKLWEISSICFTVVTWPEAGSMKRYGSRSQLSRMEEKHNDGGGVEEVRIRKSYQYQHTHITADTNLLKGP